MEDQTQNVEDCSGQSEYATEEDARADLINTNAGTVLEEIMNLLENGTLDEDTLLADTYGRMAALEMIGFSTLELAESAMETSEFMIDVNSEPVDGEE